MQNEHHPFVYLRCTISMFRGQWVLYGIVTPNVGDSNGMNSTQNFNIYSYLVDGSRKTNTQLNKSTDRRGSDYISCHLFFGRTFCGTCAKPPESATSYRGTNSITKVRVLTEDEMILFKLCMREPVESETLTTKRETSGLFATEV